MKLDNPHLIDLDVDHLHHLGFPADSQCKEKYGDVKFVCLSGSAGRAKKFAKFMSKELKFSGSEEVTFKDHCLTDRYVMYKVGPVLIANHGMGVPSLRIILNELLKLMYYAGAKDVTFFRIGTSGGIGLKAGTVVVTNKAVNGCFEPKLRDIVLGEVKEYDTEFRFSDFAKLQTTIEKVHESKHFDFLFGSTMCCDDFYEGQGRLDGAFCDYSKEDRLQYLRTAHEKGVRNFEMECSLFAAMCNRAEVASFVICVTLLDRLKGDQVTLSPEELHEFEERPFDVVCAYMKSCLAESQ